ncbi:MAG: hypothetical protein RL341_638 [Pseudomonadota bacterium]|jgi:hypothetical protein
MQRITSAIASVVRQPFLAAPVWLAMALLLGACAAPMQAGQDASQVQAARGAPSIKAKTAAGERWIYANTFAQFNTTVEFDAAGKVIRSYNGLTDANFATIETGKWTRDEIMAAFGPPAEKGRVGWGAHTFDVWSYRYKQNGQADMLMNVHFDSSGKVAKFYPTIDPYFDPGDRDKTSLLR